MASPEDASFRELPCSRHQSGCEHPELLDMWVILMDISPGKDPVTLGAMYELPMSDRPGSVLRRSASTGCG